MITFTVDVPEDQVEFFKELMEENGFSAAEDDLEIPEEHKAIVRERMQAYRKDPSRLLDWEDIKDTW